MAVDVGDRRADRRVACSTPAGASCRAGLVDLHAHLRQPGREEAETVETGQPRRRPRRLHGRGAPCPTPRRRSTRRPSSARCWSWPRRRVLPRRAGGGRITEGRRGERLAPVRRDGRARRADVHRRRRRGAGRPAHAPGAGVRPAASACSLAQHCEDRALAGGGAMHEGEWSSRLGLPGQPAEAEELMVMRDLALCRLTGAPVHFLHLSTAGSVELVRRAKAAGLPVTAEATPHHFTLTDAALRRLRPGVQGQPAAAHREPTSPRCGPAWPTAPSTPSPPTTPPTPRRPRTALRPGATRHARPRDGAGAHC